MTWVKRCTFAIGTKLTPALARRTAPNIVPTVVMANTDVTTTRPKRLLCAAGYIKIGIKGSQGPKAKMINRVQGATLTPALLS